jgi:hypothetical protein
MSDFAPAYKAMINVHGWTGTSATLGLKRQALEQRVYGFNGHGMRVETAMTLQNYSGTKHFAQAVAIASDGVFFELPKMEVVDRTDLLTKCHQLHAEIGRLSADLERFLEDNELTDDEHRDLQVREQKIHKALCEYMALTYMVYRPRPTHSTETI